MEKIKILLYCCKQPHKLFNTDKGFVLSDFELGDAYKEKTLLNGKIVAECDFEAEEIKREIMTGIYECGWISPSKYDWCFDKDLLDKSCLTNDQACDYLDGKNGYAIHIKNLNIFDKPRELNCYFLEGKPVKISDDLKLSTAKAIKQAPQNMCYVRGCNTGEKYILISIRAEWLCKILNKEKEIEVRKKVLKEMI